MRKWLIHSILKYQHSIPSTEINDQKNWIITYLQPAIILWLVTQRSFSTGDCVAYFAASWVNWVLLCHRKHIRVVLSNDRHFGFGANGSMIKWNWQKTRPKFTGVHSKSLSWLIRYPVWIQKCESPHAHTLDVADGTLQVSFKYSEFPSITLSVHNYFVLKHGYHILQRLKVTGISDNWILSSGECCFIPSQKAS